MNEQTLHGMIRAAAAQSPDAPAVAAAGTVLTFAELEKRASALAATLRASGVKPGVIVAVMMRRTPELVVAMLGVMMAGGAYLPIDPSYPAERIAFMLRDARVPIVLTHADLVASVPAGTAEPMVLAAGGLPLVDKPVSLVGAVAAGAEDLAYVIYTSGSTGVPKGAMLRHRGVVNYLTWCIEAYRVRDGIGAPVHSSISFDLTVTSLWAPLAAGRTAFLLPDEEGVDGLVKAFRSHRNFSLVKITPAHLVLLRDALSADDVAGRARVFVIGGEALSGEALAWWQEHAPETVHVNEYGPTETVVGCCVQFVRDGQRITGDVPIGRPIANTRLYVLDAQGRPAPIGVPGELYVGGDGVGAGYFGREDLTAARFLADPFTGDDTARMYRTGDQVRWRPDGVMEFLGRLDNQVKLRGYRIELGEIESVLTRQPGVQSAVVLLREDVPGDQRLVAYYVGASTETASLRDAMAKTLPAYMVPSHVIRLDAWPLTENGKVDRKKLPPPAIGRVAVERESMPPGTALEIALARIWAEILGHHNIGAQDDFFELGGHSLLATRMMARVRSTYGVELTLRELFARPTLRELAASIEQRRQGNDETPVNRGGTEPGSTSLVAIQPRGTKTPLFCMHAGVGTIVIYYQLARALGPDQPLYGLQAQGLYDDEVPHNSIESMAAHYIREIRTIQPRGPYHLAGFCLGATIAFEMAVQLARVGETVSTLSAFDGLAPWYKPGSEALLPPPPRGLRRLVLSATIALSNRRNRFFRAWIRRFGGPVPTIFKRFEWYVAVNNHLANTSYVPDYTYDGAMRVYMSKGRYPLPSLGWRRYVAGEVIELAVPGNFKAHRDLIHPPMVNVIADDLAQAMTGPASEATIAVHSA